MHNIYPLSTQFLLTLPSAKKKTGGIHTVFKIRKLDFSVIMYFQSWKMYGIFKNVWKTITRGFKNMPFTLYFITIDSTLQDIKWTPDMC